MPTKRQSQFHKEVAAAARSMKCAARRGQFMPVTMTTESCAKGLLAMRSATRCKGVNRSGKPCQAPAMRRPSRCLKHGGRVVVPEHPHNIRRFFNGETRRPEPSESDGMTDQEHWDQLPYRLKREVLDLLPPQVVSNPSKLFLAARIWMEVRESDFPTVRKFLNTFVWGSSKSVF